MQQATQPDQTYCGIKPYLMTITSEAEKDFVQAKMVSQFGDWQNGWIGASRIRIWNGGGIAGQTVKRCFGLVMVLVRR